MCPPAYPPQKGSQRNPRKQILPQTGCFTEMLGESRLINSLNSSQNQAMTCTKGPPVSTGSGSAKRKRLGFPGRWTCRAPGDGGLASTLPSRGVPHQSCHDFGKRRGKQKWWDEVRRTGKQKNTSYISKGLNVSSGQSALNSSGSDLYTDLGFSKPQLGTCAWMEVGRDWARCLMLRHM